MDFGSEDKEQLEDICSILEEKGKRIGLASLRPVEIKGTLYFYPELPAKDYDENSANI